MDGTRTRVEIEHETPEITPDRASSEPIESTRLETIVQVSKPEATEAGAESVDRDEADLVRKMMAAADAGRHTLSLEYERKLDALRAAKRAGNVIALSTWRRGQ